MTHPPADYGFKAPEHNEKPGTGILFYWMVGMGFVISVLILSPMICICKGVISSHSRPATDLVKSAEVRRPGLSQMVSLAIKSIEFFVLKYRT
jgi:hypothetical protein